MKNVEASSDKRLNWQAVIADAHLNMLSVDPLWKHLHPLFGDGPVYYKYVQNIFSILNKMVDDEKIESTVLLGDFFDSMQTEGQDIIHTFLKDYRDKKKWALKKRENSEFMEAVKDYLKIKNLVNKKSLDNKNYFKYIEGNHEKLSNLKEIDVKVYESFSDEDDIFTMTHGDKYDFPMHVACLAKNQLGKKICVQRIPPADKNGIMSKVFRKMCISAKSYIKGVAFLATITNNKIKEFSSDNSEREGNYSPCFDLMNKKYGKEIAKKYITSGYTYSSCDKGIKKYHKDFGNFIITGHEHKAGLFSDGVILGDLYDYGVNFVASDKTNVYVLLGMKGPNKVKELDNEYDNLFEIGHMWKYSLQKKSWKFLGDVNNEGIESALANPEYLLNKRKSIRNTSTNLTELMSNNEEYSSIPLFLF